MNKTEIAVAVMTEGEKLGYKIKKSHAETLVSTVFSQVAAGLVKGDRVALTELGVFTARQYPAGIRRSPQTGEKVNVPARTKARFKEGKFLKEALAGVPIAPDVAAVKPK